MNWGTMTGGFIADRKHTQQEHSTLTKSTHGPVTQTV
jgi:hypothetical protein